MLAAAPAAVATTTATEEKTGGKSDSGPDPSPRPARTTVSSAGFAIPINDLKPIVEEMRFAKFYARAWIGVDLREEAKIEQDPMMVRVRRTLRIEGVYPDSPAAKAGLRIGDVIEKLNGRESRSLGDFRAVIVGLRYNTPLSVEVSRDGRPIRVSVPFEMRPPGPKGAEVSPGG
jgi:serine protease Do